MFFSFAAQRSAQRGGAVSETKHQAQGAGGQTPGEQRRTGMEQVQREGTNPRRANIADARLCRSVVVYSCSFLPQVKDEVLSILRLLHPLTEAGSGMSPQPSPEDQHLDTSLAQLQNVARELAISHTKQVKATPTEIQRVSRQSCRISEFTLLLGVKNVHFARTGRTKREEDWRQLREIIISDSSHLS